MLDISHWIHRERDTGAKMEVVIEKKNSRIDTNKKHKALTVLFSFTHTHTQCNERHHIEHWQLMLENVSGSPEAMESPRMYL